MLTCDPTSRVAARRRGFTLLEAVLSLIILTAVLSICLQIRVQGVHQANTVARMQQEDQAIEALFQQAIHNALPGEAPPNENGVRRWEGEHLGASYTIERQPTRMANPALAAAGPDAAPTVEVFEYTMTWGETTTSFYWHR